MKPIRRAEAPRLIDWTGERMVPWAPNVQVIYEHLQRYCFAAGLAAGRRALDVGSGEGYGAAILASTAESVVGIELDERSVAHSRLNYAASNLEFRQGSALDLSEFAGGNFGLVTCFEVIEHIAEQEQLLDEIWRALAPGGILLCSTPNRLTYSELSDHDNPYHVHELDEPEFREMLGSRFAHVRLWGQCTTTGATMYALDGEAGQSQTIFVEREEAGWSKTAAPAPIYMVAAASAQPLTHTPGDVALADPGMALVRSAELGSAEAALRAGAQRQRDLEREAHDLRERLDIARDQLHRVQVSVIWRMLEQTRGRLLEGPSGERNAFGRAISTSLLRVAPLLSRGADKAAVRALRFADHAAVKASIVIPVHNQADATAACLRALAATTAAVPYEVIIVDDASGPKTKKMLTRVRGARILRNDENQGFLRSSNRGAAAARGDHIVLLNNDTEVKPGWLQPLVDLVESADDVGAVGARLLLPDGRVQEAGAIVWRDGGAHHVGRGELPEEAVLNYVRSVDYCSAACLLVRGDVWRDLGGFDERYAPAYYEDVDLCFAIRGRGLQVLYQPRAEVIHREGTTSGVDVTTGVKAYQVRNADVFADKWRDVLEREQPKHDLESISRVMDRARGTRVLVIDHHVPRVLEDAGSVRMKEMLLALRDLGCSVTFWPAIGDRFEPQTSELQQSGIEVLYGAVDERRYLSDLGRDLDLAILSRPTVASHYLHLLREFTPEARVVFDTVDLHYMRALRRAESENDSKHERVSKSFRELELGLVRACDETIAVSEAERRTILEEVPDARVTVLPTINRVVEECAPAFGRSGLMFLGGFEHPPNSDAAVHLVENLLPLIRRELGPVEVAIVGSHPTVEVEVLARFEGVEVTGFVEDLTPWLQRSRVMAAPLRYGAGVKGKLTHSMASGLPIVTTPVGAEGLCAQDGTELLIAADDDAFVAAVARLYRDDELWLRMSEAGRALAGQRFAPTVARDALAEILRRAGPPADPASWNVFASASASAPSHS